MSIFASMRSVTEAFGDAEDDASRLPEADGGGHDGGWLCPTKADRVRLTDMSPAVRRARILAGVFCGIGVLAMIPWLGWRVLVVFAVVPVPLVILDRLLARARRPERIVAASLTLHTILIVVGVGITGGVGSPLLPRVAIPVVTAAARFRMPVFVTGSLLAMIALIASTSLASTSALLHNPSPLIAIVVLLAALVAAQRPLLDAEIRWRRDAVLDP